VGREKKGRSGRQAFPADDITGRLRKKGFIWLETQVTKGGLRVSLSRGHPGPCQTGGKCQNAGVKGISGREYVFSKRKMGG